MSFDQDKQKSKLDRWELTIDNFDCLNYYILYLLVSEAVTQACFWKKKL